MENIMKMNWFIRLLSLVFFTSMAFGAYADTYKIDPSHSAILWKVSHLGFTDYYGKWPVSGTLDLDSKSPKNSKVNVTIDMKSIVTGDPALDKELGSPDWFDFDKYPTATFVSDSVKVMGKTKAKVSGTLTLHGISKPVVLDVTFNKQGVNQASQTPNTESIGFTATAKIKRSDFGVSAYVPLVGDEIPLVIEVEGDKVVEGNKAE